MDVLVGISAGMDVQVILHSGFRFYGRIKEFHGVRVMVLLVDDGTSEGPTANILTEQIAAIVR